MKTHLFHLQDILQAFARSKVLTREEILQAAGCSSMTAWRLLCEHGYVTSYNDNARHYTLVGIPQFDEHGLWAYHQVRFSKWGSLTKTIVAVIQDSVAGMTAGQLQQLLHVKNVKPTLTRLIHNQSLTREKVDGRFVYFPLQEAPRRRKQKQRQKETKQAHAAHTLPPLEHIVALLVQIIQRPGDTTRQWARRLAQRGFRLGSQEIQAILEHYGIDVKKGLLNF